MTPTTIYLTAKQRKALLSRVRKHGTTLSEEVRAAVDLYLEMSPDFEKESLALLTREAKASMDRSVAGLDHAIASCRRAAEKLADFDRRLRRLQEFSPYHVCASKAHASRLSHWVMVSR